MTILTATLEPKLLEFLRQLVPYTITIGALLDPNFPMQRAHAAPRCTARSKRTGLRCKAPAVRGFRRNGSRALTSVIATAESFSTPMAYELT